MRLTQAFFPPTIIVWSRPEAPPTPLSGLDSLGLALCFFGLEVQLSLSQEWSACSWTFPFTSAMALMTFKCFPWLSPSGLRCSYSLYIHVLVWARRSSASLHSSVWTSSSVQLVSNPKLHYAVKALWSLSCNYEIFSCNYEIRRPFF